MKSSVLFVCFGNICRSTMAEALLRDMVRKASEDELWDIDSAGHGTWHIEKNPEPRTLQVLEEQEGITEYTHTARLIREEDFFRFTHILCMDEYNMTNLEAMKPVDSKAKIQMLSEFDPQGDKVIYDPYFSDSIEAYKEVHRQCSRCLKVFFNEESKQRNYQEKRL